MSYPLHMKLTIEWVTIDSQQEDWLPLFSDTHTYTKHTHKIILSKRNAKFIKWNTYEDWIRTPKFGMWAFIFN
jgi:hypothetical protein